MIYPMNFFIKTFFYLQNLISHHVSFLSPIFFFFSRNTILHTDNTSSKQSFLEPDMIEFENPVSDAENEEEEEDEEEEEERESSGLVFKFAFQTETFERLRREGYRSSNGETNFFSSSPTVGKYETPPAKNLTFVYEKPEAVSFRVEESFPMSKGDKTEDSVLNNKEETETETEHSVSVSSGEKQNVEKKTCLISERFKFLTENDFVESTDSDSCFVDSSGIFTSQDEGFLSDSDFDETSPEQGQNRNNEKEGSGSGFASGSGSDSGSDSEEDTSGLESLWEHQDLIEQLKLEIKKVKAISGLPTIREDEEDECPKMVGDLKPWKIEEKKFTHVDTMGELHRFHRSYRERMRKLDILSFQKSYALQLLRTKNTKEAIPAVGNSLSWYFLVNIGLCKPKKAETEPLAKFIREIDGELENVYVGHMCLSWEILHWQYEKAIQLVESDVYGARRYNEVAGEFQQFQVLLQRFLENEEFEEPRIQHYVKKRCVLRNLLQVPVIREDGNKEKRRGRGEDGAIKSEQLVEIMEETIRLFWRFVRFDKLTNSILDQKSGTKSQIEPDHEDLQDLEMFSEVKSELQNKEKRLKNVLKGERCMLRRFQKHKEEDSRTAAIDHQVLYFFSQVDMKLVTRVLNMSKLSKEHLVWCRNKLTKISFVNRRLRLDPSFCLFPC